MKSVITLLCCSLALTACQEGWGPMGVDKQAIFDSLPGPDVDGVEDTLVKSARAHEARGDYEKMTQLYRQLLSIDETNRDYLLQFGAGLRRTGDLDRAQRVFNKVLSEDAGNLDALEGKALVKMQRGEFDEAGEMLAKVQAQDPTRWRTLNALAILFVERGQLEEGLAYFKEAIKYSQDNISVLNNVGLTHAINDDPEKAIAALSRAAQVSEPGTPLKRSVELNLAMVMGIYGDLDVAEQILTEHLPEAAVANNLGLYAYLAKEEELARSYLNMALSKSPYHYRRAWENLMTITENSAGQKAGKRLRGKVVKVPQ